jgi:Bacterial protein of unknown function (DUF899)
MPHNRIGSEEEWIAARKQHLGRGLSELLVSCGSYRWCARPSERSQRHTYCGLAGALSPHRSFQKRMGWRFKWVASYGNGFNYDYHVSATNDDLAKGDMYYNYETGPIGVEELPGISVFYKDETGQVFHTYSSYARGGDLLIGAYNFLDLTPKGRDEDGLAFRMAWVRHHDRYGSNYAVDRKVTYTPPQGSICSHCSEVSQA